MDKANDLDKTAWPHPHFCQYCHSVDFDAVYHVLSLHATLRVPLRTTVTWSRVRSTKNADSPLPIRFQICPSLLHATLTLPAPSPLIATELTLVEVKSRSANQLNNEWLTSPRASLSIHLSLTHTTLFTFWKGSTIIRKKKPWYGGNIITFTHINLKNNKYNEYSRYKWQKAMSGFFHGGAFPQHVFRPVRVRVGEYLWPMVSETVTDGEMRTIQRS